MGTERGRRAIVIDSYPGGDYRSLDASRAAKVAERPVVRQSHSLSESNSLTVIKESYALLTENLPIGGLAVV